MDAQQAELASQPGFKSNQANQRFNEEEESLLGPRKSFPQNSMPPPMDTDKADQHHQDMMDMTTESECIKDGSQSDPQGNQLYSSSTASVPVPPGHLARKVNTQLVSSLKFCDSKKRSRAAGASQQTFGGQQNAESQDVSKVTQNTMLPSSASSSQKFSNYQNNVPLSSQMLTADKDQIMQNTSMMASQNHSVGQ